MYPSTPQEISRLRDAILLELLPSVAIASYAEAIAFELRNRRRLPEATARVVTTQLEQLEKLGQVQQIKAARNAHAADKGWQLTGAGVEAAELLQFS